MQRLCIVAVGSMTERFFAEAQSEYIKRLGRYASIEVTECADEKAPRSLSAAQEDAVKRKEGERILSKLSPRDRVIALDLSGSSPSSAELAKKLAVWSDRRTVFVIGGSLGLHGDVLARADERLKLSEMTFTHNMARLILLEQLYRGFKINNNEQYHK